MLFLADGRNDTGQWPYDKAFSRVKEGRLYAPLSIGRRSAALGVLALVAAWTASVQSALAQDETELANVLGLVMQAGSRAPLADATVEIPGLELSMVSDETGRFWFRNIPAGEHIFVIQYLGFTDSTRVFLLANELNQIEVGIDLRIVPVPDLVVQVESIEAPSKLTEFNRRRAHGEGYFITREDIQRRDPVRTTDMLRTVPGIRVAAAGIGRPAIRMRGRACNIAYFVDGIRAPYFNMDNIQPSSVAGIEIYKGTSSVPPEFRGALTPCAAIVIWTRDPSLP